MKHPCITAALAASVLLLGASLAFAADTKAATPQPAASNAAASKNVVRAKPKAAAPIKLVDINSASSEALKKLPGIGDAEAAKIIAGRPYGSKAWLLSHNILAADKYPAIKDLIIAKQPTKGVAKNEAAIAKKNLETQTPKK